MKNRSGWLVFGAGLAVLQFARLAAMGVNGWMRPPRVRWPDTPARWGLRYADVEFPARDGVRLRGWFFDAPTTAGDAPRPAVIVCHGHGGDKSPHINLAIWFREAGIPLLLFDFRNHGLSDGDLTSIGYYERYDVLGAVDWLAARGMTRIGLFGFSMGAATALAAAPFSQNIVCVVSDSAFAHVRPVVAGVVSRQMPVQPLARMLERLIWRLVQRRLRCRLEDADPLAMVRQFGERPLLLIHGTLDEYIDPAQAEALREAASGPTELWLVDGAAHTSIDHLRPKEYREWVMGFFVRHLGP
ncbi:MAG: alpha/beta hydrolase [Chloroflexi bacterium]|nr:alpha/beta hydrolase [Chloroflexota bacterium]